MFGWVWNNVLVCAKMDDLRAHMGSRNRAVGFQWLVLDLPSLPLLSGKLRWCFPSCSSFMSTFPSELVQVVRRPMVMEAKQEEVRLDKTAIWLYLGFTICQTQSNQNEY